MDQWLFTSWPDVAWALLSATVLYLAIIVYIRMTGLRSFSKMAAPDFAMTIAIGSIFGASIVNPSPSIALAAAGLGSLFVLQWLVACVRTRFSTIRTMVDNDPLLLMDGSTILDANLRSANVSRSDLYAKLREANVWSFNQVISVVFETTGDISVLHRSAEAELEPEAAIFQGVRGQ